MEQQEELQEAARRLAADVARVVYEQEAGLFDFPRADGAARIVIGQFFASLGRKAGAAPAAIGFRARLKALLGGAR